MNPRRLCRCLFAGAWLGAAASAWAQPAGFRFDPDHLGIEPAASKEYFVRLLPPPASDVHVAISLGACAEFVEVDVDTLLYTPETRWRRVVLTAKEWAPEDAEPHPCALFFVQHRVTETADVPFQGVRGYLPVEVTANRAPVVSNPIPDQAMDPSAQATFRLGDVFWEPDGDPLRYAASTSDDQAARAFVDDGMLEVVAGRHPGKAFVAVTATDPQDLETEFVLVVRVGALVTLVGDAEATEGGTATLAVAMARPQSQPVAVPFAIGPDEVPETPDADAGEYGAATGVVVFATGETTAAIAIGIADDERIEPAEERFVVSLLPTADRGYAVERAEATVVVREGVCDRTPQVRDVLSKVYDALAERLVPIPCTEPTVATLGARKDLKLAAQSINALRSNDLLGLAALELVDLRGNRLATLPARFFRHTANLRVVDLGRNRLPELDPDLFAPIEELFALRLDGNLLEELPPGLFAGFGEVYELRLDDNPGAPFPLGVTLVRTDAERFAPPPATVRATFAPHAPFALTSDLTVEGGTASTSQVALAPGQYQSAPVVVHSPGGAARVGAGAPSLPTRLCIPDLRRCVRGLRPVAAPPLALFAMPPPTVRLGGVADAEVVAGDTLRLVLGEVFTAADDQPLRYAVAVAPPLTAWRIGNGVLMLTANDEEGTAIVTVTATGANGLEAVLSFAVTTLPRGRGFASGWRRALGAAPASSP